MEAEASSFETSEMLAGFMASTPLLLDSWRLCTIANSTAPENFVVDQIGDVGYVAFSGIQQSTGMNPSYSNLVQLDSVGNGLFSSLHYHNEDMEPPMVHAGMLHIFFSIWNSPGFQNQMSAVMEKCKAVIVTGHSIGGATASLTALWLLSYLQSISSSLSVLCITFGSPLLGNGCLSRVILRERWIGNFCHIVSKHDIVPRLLFSPLSTVAPQLNNLLQIWHSSMASPQFDHLPTQLSDEEKTKFCHFILVHVSEAAAVAAEEDSMKSYYRPFGSYLFCSEEGTICIENATAVVQMLHLTFMTVTANSIIEDHLKYGDVVARVSQQFLKSRSLTHGVLPKSGYEMGISLALEASGILGQDSVVKPAKKCLKMAKQIGCMPNLKSANLAIGLAKVTPCRAQIEWYKATCDDSDEQLGYYDSFKIGGASKRDSRVNMNRFKLANFWDNVILMMETNQLPHDFHKRAKWVNASHFYKLLVEPLDIAEYYRKGTHRTRGHYLMHGRERRYVIFDRWWNERKTKNEDNNKRSKFAGLTQDSCFWARVEEARDWLENAKSENDLQKLAWLRESIHKFELYARQLVDCKEVSKDVVAKNSSYSVWVEDLRNSMQIPPQFPG